MIYRLSRNYLTCLPLQPKVNPDTRKLANIFSALRKNAPTIQLKREVDCYMCNLEPRRLRAICPSWWPPQLEFSSLDCLSNDRKIRYSTTYLVAYDQQNSFMSQPAFYLTTKIK